MNRHPSPLARSVDTLLRDLPRARHTRDLIAETERKACLTWWLVGLLLFAAGVATGIWSSVLITAPKPSAADAPAKASAQEGRP